MKNKKLSKKLILNKTTVANLNHEEMKKLWAGSVPGGGECGTSCPISTCPTCPGIPETATAKDPTIND